MSNDIVDPETLDLRLWPQHDPVPEHRHGEFFDVVGNHEFAASDGRHRFAASHQGQPRSGRGADQYVMAGPGRAHDLIYVLEDLVLDDHARDFLTQLLQSLGVHYRLESDRF